MCPHEDQSTDNKTPNFTKEINTEIIKQNTEIAMVDNKYRNGR